MNNERVQTGAAANPSFIESVREVVESARVGSSLALRFNPRIFLGSAPLLTFWFVEEILDIGTQVSIGIAFLVALAVLVVARDSGIIRLLAVLSFAAVSTASLIGVIMDSEKAFLANDVIFDYVTVTVSIISIYKGKPLFRLIVHEMYPGLRTLLPDDHRVFVTLTIVLALHSVVIGTTRAFLIDSQSVGGYIIWSRVTSLTVNTIVIAIAIILMGRAVLEARRVLAASKESAET